MDDLQASPRLRHAFEEGDIEAIFPEAPAFLGPTSRNKRFTVYPDVVAFPKSAKQVAKAVEIAKNNQRRVVALSGGHSSIANGVGGSHMAGETRGVVVIALNKLKAVTFDDSEHVTFETGNRLEDVAKALKMHGRALPHGICLNVGIGGHSVFGGYGFASRMWGLNLDVIESMDVVLADGTQKTISADQDQDSKNLFWAMRGAAPSFAIVTAIKYKTFPVPGFAENFEYGRQMGFQEAAHIIHNLQIDALHTSSVPKELGLQFRIDKGNSADKVKLTLRGTYYGPQTTWVSVISPYLKQIMNITESTSGSLAEMVNSINLTGHLAADPTTSFTGGYVEEVPGDYYQSVYRNAADPTVTGDSIVYAKFLDQVNDTSARGVDRDIYIKTLVTSGPRILEKSLPPDPRITFYIKTLMAPQSKPITYQALEALIKYAATNGFESKLDWYVVLKLFGGKDSVITSTPSDKTSFGRRDTLWFIELNADSRTFPYPEEGYTFLDGLVKTVLVNSPQSWDYGAYPGFLDDRLDNYQHLYYGKHYDKLVELKNKFDQSNIFSFPTSIPLKKF